MREPSCQPLEMRMVLPLAGAQLVTLVLLEVRGFGTSPCPTCISSPCGYWPSPRPLPHCLVLGHLISPIPIFQVWHWPDQTRLCSSTTEDWNLTLSDLSNSEPTVSLDKPMGQLWATSSSVFEAQSLTNSEKSSGIV